MKQRIWIVGRRVLLRGIGFGKEVGANGDVGARVEEPFWIEPKSSGIVGVDLEESDRDGDPMLEKPAHPQNSFEFGVRLSLKLDCLVGESKSARDFLGAVDADCVGVKARLRFCDGKHGIECGVWSAALEKNDHLVL